MNQTNTIHHNAAVVREKDRIVELMRKMTPEQQEKLIALLEALLKNQDKS